MPSFEPSIPTMTLTRFFTPLIFLALFAGLLGLAGPATAQTVQGRNHEALLKVERYLDSIRTMQSKFYQAGADGSVTRGTIAMKRPGRLRIEYAPPSPALIIADGRWFIFYDKELEHPSYTPIDDTLAGFLVRKKIRLSGDVKVTRYVHEKGVIRVSIVHRDEPEQGSLTFLFSDNPLKLLQWQVIDSQGGETRVSLIDPEFGMPLNSKLFEFRAPKTDSE
ncbi:MAG: outer membrane lipoprotein carrier protein LolA [Rhodospirillales bacterium]|jgi:outer membrane lipoprotein-sorting protein|nr:outer membrane lipoprotein carrier protein LolA [Rhodospirillales bacterium]MBT4006252.1 outer membrane lipoprotein carrier protein LolA [Rhodospirillales bacterium]MBT5075640.1 outer membrane lipoprotein carrier protein LolA [Rhodospirillales bacterium]MBT5112374.1 outer membrane lipoprotein carrier protein LolA [Rhodospirillales bacterium]MBT5672075.1 outer membrane lipoprotein carrier protein LolA [Rhodospirillales bacterium]